MIVMVKLMITWSVLLRHNQHDWHLQGIKCKWEMVCEGVRRPLGCNGVDDDCNGITDDEDADGCFPHYLDLDGDGWGYSRSNAFVVQKEATELPWRLR